MNKDIKALRERLQQLETQHKAGAVGRKAYDTGKAQLEREILEAVLAAPAAGASAPSPRPSGPMTAALLSFVVVLAVAGYAWTGSPGVPSAGPPGTNAAGADLSNPHAGGSEQEQFAAAVQKLAERLKGQPDDAEGWAMRQLVPGFREVSCVKRPMESPTSNSQEASAEPVLQTIFSDGLTYVSLFIEPDRAPIEASARLGADIVELHTGTYCEHALENDWQRVEKEVQRIVVAARVAHAAGLEVHAGHGLTYNTVGEIAAIPEIAELNIGHFLIGEAIMIGLRPAIERMSALMREARSSAGGGGSRRI